VGDRAAAGGDAKLVAESALAVGHTVAEVSGDTPLLTVLDRALRQQCIAPADRARLCARRAIATYWLSGGQAESRRRSAEAVAVAREAGDPDALGAALVARQFTLRGPDHLDERIQTGAAALSLASASGDEDLRFRALQWLVPDRFQAGAMLEVAESIEELHALAERRRDPLRRWWVLIYRGLMAAFDGRFGEAEQLAHDAFTWGRRLGQPAADAYRIGQLSRIYWSTGRLSLLGSEVTDAIGRFPGWSPCAASGHWSWPPQAAGRRRYVRHAVWWATTSPSSRGTLCSSPASPCWRRPLWPVGTTISPHLC